MVLTNAWWRGVGLMLIAAVVVTACRHGEVSVNDISVLADGMPDPASDGRLVHVSGMVRSDEMLSDPLLGIQEPVIALIRCVEMYQWQEVHHGSGLMRSQADSPRRIHYRPLWADHVIDSSEFEKASSYPNPDHMPITANVIRSTRVKLGAFDLDSEWFGQDQFAGHYPLSRAHLVHWPERLHERIDDRQPDWLYVGDPLMPRIGDLRIRVRVVREQPVSLLAVQRGDVLEPVRLEYLAAGVVGVEELLARGHKPRPHGGTAVGLAVAVLVVLISVTFRIFSTKE